MPTWSRSSRWWKAQWWCCANSKMPPNWWNAHSQTWTITFRPSSWPDGRCYQGPAKGLLHSCHDKDSGTGWNITARPWMIIFQAFTLA